MPILLETLELYRVLTSFSARLVDEPFPWTEHRIRVWSFFFLLFLSVLLLRLTKSPEKYPKLSYSI